MGKLVHALIALLVMLSAIGCVREPPPLPEGYKPPPETTNAPQATFISVIGDSYSSGTRMGGRGAQGWPAQAEKRLRQSGTPAEVKVGAEGGSGYVARGEHGLTFADEVPKVVAPKDRLVVISGSSNDTRDVPAGALGPAVESTLAAIKTAAPHANLLVIGPFYTAANPPPALLEARDTVRATAEAAGATFVDPVDWFVGHPELISSDGAHPTDAGHVYLADRIVPLITEAIVQK